MLVIETVNDHDIHTNIYNFDQVHVLNLNDNERLRDGDGDGNLMKMKH